MQVFTKVLTLLAFVFAAQTSAAQDAVEPMEDRFIGNPDATVTVIEYASLTCPHCANFHTQVYPELKANFIDTDKIKFVFREVYFDKYGLWAGMLARCGNDDRYFPMIDMFLKTQKSWLDGSNDVEVVNNMYKIGRQTGLTNAQMEACVQDGDLASALVADYQLKAGADEIASTPSFVINGDVKGNMSYAEFEKLLNEALN